jgi:predicted lipid-binding transport protein (Tim44 family)
MDLISILTTVILTTTIGTVIVGFAAYGAFKLRDKRKPKANSAQSGAADGQIEAIFLTPYVPVAADAMAPAPAAASAPATATATATATSTATATESVSH